MRRLTLAGLVLALCVPVVPIAQDAATQLQPFTRTLSTDGLTLSLVHLNNRTVPVLFQPPTLYAMRARAAESTLLYVQGTAERNVRLDTTTFTIEQDGRTFTATPMNIRHFDRGRASIPAGERVDGVLAFEGQVDTSKAFVVRHGDDAVEFRLSEDALREIADAAPPQ